MAEKPSLLQKFKNLKLLKNKHITYTLVILLCCIALLIAVSGFTKKSKTVQDNSSTSLQSVQQSSSAIAYANAVSSNLQNIINSVKGISNAKVLVVVTESPTIKYLTEETNGNTAIVYNKQGSSYQPVAIAEFLPKITGILIVANGTTNLAVKNNLLNAISAVYNVDISRIDILEGK